MPAGVRQLLDVVGLPAFVEGRYFDVLAANALARALSPNLQDGRNRLRAVFLDPAEQALYPDWDQATAGLVAGFRESVGTDVDDPRFVQLVGELSLSSERFRQLWARHDVQSREGRPVRLRPPPGRATSLCTGRSSPSAGPRASCSPIYHAQPGTEQRREAWPARRPWPARRMNRLPQASPQITGIFFANGYIGCPDAGDGAAEPGPDPPICLIDGHDVPHCVLMTIRLNDPAPERKTLALTARDLEDLDQLRSPGPERTALAELSGSALRGEVSEAVLLHAVFTAGLRAVREMTEARAYAEAVFERRGPHCRPARAGRCARSRLS